MTFTRALSATALGFVALTGPVRADPVSVPFDPPRVEAGSDTCLPRPPQHVLTERWQDYDGGPVGGRDIALIRRDLRLLRQNDPERWFDTIEAANDRLLEVVDSYDETNRLLDRLDLLVAAGRMAELAESGLVDRVLEIAPSGTTSAKRTAADLLFEGTGVERDQDRAIDLWRQAAYAGDGASLLRMVELSYERDLDDWDIAPDVAVTMALGDLLGDLDPRLCDRVNRIAAVFLDGEAVAPDPDLAEDWYRFAADLGGHNAAWNLAEMHREAIEVEKDNDLMMQSLRQAAGFDLPYAMLQLAAILERGALAERDLAEARALYEEAADFGDPTARIRLVNLARDRADGPEGRDRLAAALDRMIDAPDTPGWAYVQRGDLVMVEDGRWAGADRAAELYRTAVEIDPSLSAAQMRLAGLMLRETETEQDLLDVVSTLRNAVYVDGQTEPMQDLQAIFRCRSAVAPVPSEAEYWTRMESFAGDTTVEVDPGRLDELTVEDDPMTLARLQSQAVNMRSRSLANFHEVLPGGASDAMRRMTREAGGALFVAEAKLALNRGDVGAAEDRLGRAIDAGEPGARAQLVSLLADTKDLDGDRRARLVTLARDLAAEGNGAAIRTLIEIGETDPDAAWQRYSDAIARNGDVDALLFALPYLESASRTEEYRNRIRSTIDCTTSKALQYARVLQGIGADDAVGQWIDVAEAVSGGDGWERVAIGDAMRELGGGEADEARALALYRAAADGGYSVGLRRLLSLRQDGEIEMSADETARMSIRLLRIADTEDIPVILNFLEYSDPQVRRIVNAEIDRRALYAEAAGNGNAVAQLELARIVRDSDAEGDTSDRYADLLRRSADGGNAEAMYLLSQAYAYGVGVEQSAAQSRRWLTAAAEAGNETAASTARMIQ